MLHHVALVRTDISVVGKFRERLAMNKHRISYGEVQSQMERFSLKKLNEAEGKEK
jgi:hypothetical protein